MYNETNKTTKKKATLFFNIFKFKYNMLNDY